MPVEWKSTLTARTRPAGRNGRGCLLSVRPHVADQQLREFIKTGDGHHAGRKRRSRTAVSVKPDAAHAGVPRGHGVEVEPVANVHNLGGRNVKGGAGSVEDHW